MVNTDYIFGNSKLPLIALAIHNGHHMPPELAEITTVPEKIRLMEEDPYTGTIAARFANHVIVNDSRFAVDLNRPVQKSVYREPDDCWGLKVRSVDIQAGLLYRLHHSHEEWYEMLAYQLDRMLLFHPEIFVLDLHSYNHRRGGPGAEPDPQAENPDLILGRSNLGAEQYPKIEKLRERLNGQPWNGIELDCRCDVKFSGGYLPRWVNSRYEGRVTCLAVEFKKTWMDEHSGELCEKAFTELKDIFVREFLAFLRFDLGGRFSQI